MSLCRSASRKRKREHHVEKRTGLSFRVHGSQRYLSYLPRSSTVGRAVVLGRLEANDAQPTKAVVACEACPHQARTRCRVRAGSGKLPTHQSGAHGHPALPGFEAVKARPEGLWSDRIVVVHKTYLNLCVDNSNTVLLVGHPLHCRL